MASIKQLFWELKLEAIKIAMFRGFLNAIIIFLLFNIVFSFFNIEWYYALIIGFFAFLFNSYTHYHHITLKMIEQKNPHVNEMLRTIKDNVDNDNTMTRALALDVIKRAKNIASGTLMDYQKLIYKAVLIGVLSLIMIFVASFNIKIGEIELPLADFGLENVRFGSAGPVDLNDTYLLDDDSIYGDANTIALGNEQLDLNILPSLSEVDLSQEKGLEELGFDRNTYPTDVSVRGAASGTQKRPDEADLVNAYYLQKNQR